MKKTALIFLGALTASIFPLLAIGQQSHGDHSHANKKMAVAPQEAIEPGQGAFAAISEIVAILQADPNTEWRKVDINRLREHLVDMDQLTLNASVRQREEANQIIFEVIGTGRTVRAIKAMTPAHAIELNKSTNWEVTAESTDDGSIMRLSSDQVGELEKIKALGFFGIMATGAHHQEHHLAMARGKGHQ